MGTCGEPACRTAPSSKSMWWSPRSGRFAISSGWTGAGLAAGFWGVGCDAGCRAFDVNGVVTDTSSWPATSPAPRTCSSTISFWRWSTGTTPSWARRSPPTTWCSDETDRRPHLLIAAVFGRDSSASTSSQSGCRRSATKSCFTQGSFKARRFAAAYGRRGRIVGAVTFDHGKWMPYYGAQIAAFGAVSALARPVLIFPRTCGRCPPSSRHAASHRCSRRRVDRSRPRPSGKAEFRPRASAEQAS